MKKLYFPLPKIIWDFIFSIISNLFCKIKKIKKITTALLNISFWVAWSIYWKKKRFEGLTKEIHKLTAVMYDSPPISNLQQNSPRTLPES